MTKYASTNDGTYISCYHEDPECKLMKKEPREITEQYIAYHELSPCWRCSDGSRPKNRKPDMRYQNATIDEDNDPLDRIHD